MIIDENYTIEKDAHNYILKYEKEGEMNPKTNKLTITRSESFHMTMRDALNSYMDKVIGCPEEISELLDAIKTAQETVNKALTLMTAKA